jgi:hypothetical protein
MYPDSVFPSTVLGGIELIALPIFMRFWNLLDKKINIMQRVCLFQYAILFSNPSGPFCTHVCSICPTETQKNRLEMLQLLRMGVHGPL